MGSRIERLRQSWLARLARISQCHNSALEVALGLAGGAWLGLLPKTNLLAVLLAAALWRLRPNPASALASLIFFTLVGWGCQDFLHRVGYLILTWRPLTPLWTQLYNLPLIPWTAFNHTCVMGGFIVGAYLFVPLCLLARWGVEHSPALSPYWVRLQRWTQRRVVPLREMLGLSR